MTLGSFIKALEAMPQDALCRFDGGRSPGEPDSYRGFYEQLAFGSGEQKSVAAVLTAARCAVDKMFEGYKGGEFWMRRDTMIWRAEYCSCGDLIVGVQITDDGSVLVKTLPYESRPQTPICPPSAVER
jgi:hypothetical protein